MSPCLVVIKFSGDVAYNPTTVSANPTKYMDILIAFAKLKIKPMLPPYAAPKLRLIKKYAPPPSTSPFVAMADNDVADKIDNKNDKKIINVPCKMPACAAT